MSIQHKKHPCPDCIVCQWCSDARCEMCQGWLVKKDVDDKAALDTAKDDQCGIAQNGKPE